MRDGYAFCGINKFTFLLLLFSGSIFGSPSACRLVHSTMATKFDSDKSGRSDGELPQEFRLTEREFNLFKRKVGLRLFLVRRFKGTTANIQTLVHALAEMLPNQKQKEFVGRHSGLSSQLVNDSANRLGAASQVVGLLLDFSRELGRTKVTVESLLTKKGMEDLLGRAPVEMSDAQFTAFKEERGLHSFLVEQFQGTSANIQALVQELAKMLSNQKKVGFVERYKDLSNHLVNDSARFKGSAAKVVICC